MSSGQDVRPRREAEGATKLVVLEERGREVGDERRRKAHDKVEESQRKNRGQRQYLYWPIGEKETSPAKGKGWTR